MIIQIFIIASAILSINILILYVALLYYQDKIKQIIKDANKEYNEILDMLDAYGTYKNNIRDKILYKKLGLKLKQELENKNNLILYMGRQIKRLYKKYFINNTK